MDEIIDHMAGLGHWIIGTPDDCIAGIEKLMERSGGFGGLLVMAQDWAPREAILNSYELMARYVMPHFQDSLTGLEISNQWSRDRTTELMAARQASIARARDSYVQQR